MDKLKEASSRPAAEPPATEAVVTAAATAGAVLTVKEDHMAATAERTANNLRRRELHTAERTSNVASRKPLKEAPTPPP